MTDPLTYTLKSRTASGIHWHSCERCATDVHHAVLSDHAVVAHKCYAWRIGQP